jgi:glycosyltransferase involved in cell wall biosynthesis
VDTTAVTIVTPSLNQGRYLPEAVASVLSQDYPGIEYLVLDGGSTDGTVEYLRSLPERVQWRSRTDGGQVAAILEGFDRGRGRVLAWLNADDALAPGAVRQSVEAFDADPSLELLYGRADFIDSSDQRLGPCAHVGPFDAARLLQDLDFIAQPAAFFSRAAFEAVGRLDADLQYCFDYDLWLRLAKRGHVRFLDEHLALVRVHPDTKTSRGGLARLIEIERMVARHGGHRLPRAFRGEMVTACLDELWRSLSSARWSMALQCVRGGLVYGLARSLRRLRGLDRPVP